MNTTDFSEIKLLTIGVWTICDVTLNTLVIAVIVRYPQLREDRTNLFMLSVMVSDLIFGLTFMPISAIVCSNTPTQRPTTFVHLPTVHLVFFRLCGFVSLNSLCWVTVCKTVAITRPFLYEQYLGTIRCYVIITTIWFVGVLVAGAAVPFTSEWITTSCVPKLVARSPLEQLTRHVFIIGVTAPVIVIAYGTARILCVILRTHRQIAAQMQSIGGVHSQSGHAVSPTVRSIRSGRIVLIICTCVVLLMMPAITYDIILSLWGNGGVSHWVDFIVIWCSASNAFVNSLLFICLCGSVRRKTAQMLTDLSKMFRQL